MKANLLDLQTALSDLAVLHQENPSGVLNLMAKRDLLANYLRSRLPSQPLSSAGNPVDSQEAAEAADLDEMEQQRITRMLADLSAEQQQTLTEVAQVYHPEADELLRSLAPIEEHEPQPV